MTDDAAEIRRTRLLLVILLVIVLVAVAVGVIGANGARTAPPADAAAAPAPIVATPEPLTPGEIIQQATGEVGINWAITSDPAINCAPEGHGGCFRPEFPNAIILSPDLRGEALRYIVLHELAHLHQYRSSLPLNECEADAQALAWGVAPDQLYYAPNC